MSDYSPARYVFLLCRLVRWLACIRSPIRLLPCAFRVLGPMIRPNVFNTITSLCLSCPSIRLRVFRPNVSGMIMACLSDSMWLGWLWDVFRMFLEWLWDGFQGTWDILRLPDTTLFFVFFVKFQGLHISWGYPVAGIRLYCSRHFPEQVRCRFQHFPTPSTLGTFGFILVPSLPPYDSLLPPSDSIFSYLLARIGPMRFWALFLTPLDSFVDCGFIRSCDVGTYDSAFLTSIWQPPFVRCRNLRDATRCAVGLWMDSKNDDPTEVTKLRRMFSCPVVRPNTDIATVGQLLLMSPTQDVFGVEVLCFWSWSFWKCRRLIFYVFRHIYCHTEAEFQGQLDT